MHVEVSVALNFVISYLYNKLPRRRVDMFGEEMERGLKKKFEGHWYDDKPFKGSAYRCIRVSAERMEPVIELAATLSRLDMTEICEYLPRDLTIWIDPGDVSYRIGEKGVVKVLYSSRQTNDGLHNVDREIAAASKGFNPDAQCFKPIDSLSSSLSNLSVSPGTTSPTPNHPGATAVAAAAALQQGSGGTTSPWGNNTAPDSISPINANTMYHGASSTSPTGSPGTSAGVGHMNGHHASNGNNTNSAMQGATATPPITSFLNRNQGNTMTTAMFAQTKFGSTKLKTQAKRPSRLSPTELGVYFKQRGPGHNAGSIGSPSGGMSPQGLGSPFGGAPPHMGGRPTSLSPRGNGSGNATGPRGTGHVLPPYGLDLSPGRGSAGLSSFYLMPQQAATAATSAHSGPHHFPTGSAPSLSDLYNHAGMGLPGSFAPPPPGPAASSYAGNQGLNTMPSRYHDAFPISSPTKGYVSGGSGSAATSPTSGSNPLFGGAGTPSPDESLSQRGFMDGLNYNNNNLPNYQTVQHLLVAN